jgi:cephalosporin-C deacetylase-like acetyl esterase
MWGGGYDAHRRSAPGHPSQEDLTVLKVEEQPKKMLYRYLVAELAKPIEERKKILASLKTPGDVFGRQAEVRGRFLAALGGLPERTPLHAQVTVVRHRDSYRVENVIYEARPDHHVTANLYLPDGMGPFPGILFPLGHYGNPKAAEEYQRTCILLAKHGLAAMAFDPIGQGEREQILKPDGKAAAHGTSEHTLVDVGALLVGSCAAQCFIWEGMRGLDYLASRPEIDPKRLGCMGHSGGGTQTSYLMALDDRIVCAIPSCYTTSLEKLFLTIGPQDGEANIPGQVAFGMGHSDYSILRAPRPTQLSTPSKDYYDIEGAWTTFREAKIVYGILGHAERMDLFETDAPHSISHPSREAALRWMRRWLLGIDDAPVENDFPVAPDAELQCTRTGHVVTDFKERTAYDFTADRETELAPQRGKLSREELLTESRRLIALGTPVKATLRESLAPSYRRTGYRIQRVLFETDPGIKIPALRFIPDEPKSIDRILYVDGEGKAKESGVGGAIEKWVLAGHEVTAIDLRGMGELEPDPPHKGLLNFVRADWKEAYLGLNLSRPLLGQRVRDLLAIVSLLSESDRGIHVVGASAAAPVALHAAALDPRIRELTLEGMVVSWSAVARTPITINQLTNVVPGVLKVYDLPDLAATIAPRTLILRGCLDPAGKPISQAALQGAYAGTQTSYAAQGCGSRLNLQAGHPNHNSP